MHDIAIATYSVVLYRKTYTLHNNASEQSMYYSKNQTYMHSGLACMHAVHLLTRINVQ